VTFLIMAFVIAAVGAAIFLAHTNGLGMSRKPPTAMPAAEPANGDVYFERYLPKPVSGQFGQPLQPPPPTGA